MTGHQQNPWTDESFVRLKLSPKRQRAVDISRERWDRRKNLDFAIVWCENNIRWLLGENPRNEDKLKFNRDEIARLQKELLTIPNPFDTVTA